MQDDIFIALGSNLGNRLENLRSALKILRHYVTIETLSHIYETAPMYVIDQPAFLNMVIKGRSEWRPVPLLRHLKSIETEVGRVPSVVNGPRLIDLDILYYGTEEVKDPHLVIPHPGINERAFVLAPMADLAPHWYGPNEGFTISERLNTVKGRDSIQKSSFEI